MVVGSALAFSHPTFKGEGRSRVPDDLEEPILAAATDLPTQGDSVMLWLTGWGRQGKRSWPLGFGLTEQGLQMGLGCFSCPDPWGRQSIVASLARRP